MSRWGCFLKSLFCSVSLCSRSSYLLFNCKALKCVSVCGKAFTAPRHHTHAAAAHHALPAHTPASALPDMADFLTFLPSHDVESFYRLSRYVYFLFSVFFLGKALGYLFLPSLCSPKGRAAGGDQVPSRDRNVDLVPAALAPFSCLPGSGSWACLTPVPASGSSPGNRASRAVHKPGMGINGRLYI